MVEREREGEIEQKYPEYRNTRRRIYEREREGDEESEQKYPE